MSILTNKTRRARQVAKISGPSIRSYVVVSCLVFLAFFGLTLWGWHSTKQSYETELANTLNFGLTITEQTLTNKLLLYEEIVRGTSALFKASKSVTGEDWDNYMTSFELAKNYPGIISVGYTPFFEHKQIESYRQAQATAINQYAIFPAGDRDAYAPVHFISSPSNGTAKQIGDDFWADPGRRNAMEQARDTGSLAITDTIKLNTQNAQSKAAFVVFAPLYWPNQPTNSTLERRAALQGFTFITIQGDELFSNLLPQLNQNDSYAIRFFDAKNADDKMAVYTSPSYDSITSKSGSVHGVRTTKVHNQDWTASLYIDENIIDGNRRQLSRNVLWSGLAFSFLLAGLLLLLMVSRARSLAYDKNQEVQEAKDELLSLASHQLRTPATGVKQFIGIILQGLAGSVPKEQKELLEKAYRSNERQLEIINQILYVTRADAGRIILDKQRFELNAVIRNTIEEQLQEIKQRKQRIVFRPSAKQIFVRADEQYLSMVLDNIINNASKYSYERRQITVLAANRRDHVDIRVVDRGVGIPEKEQHRLFQKFSRIHNELSIQAGGSGIGLYLCKKIMSLHGGKITVESSPSKGSVFMIYLPKR